MYQSTCNDSLERKLRQLGMEDAEAKKWVEKFRKGRIVDDEFKAAIKASQASPVPFIDFINEERASIFRIMSEKTSECTAKVIEIKESGKSVGYGSQELEELVVSFSGLLIRANGTLRKCDIAKRVIEQMPEQKRGRPLETSAEVRSYPKSHAQAQITMALGDQLKQLHTYAEFLSAAHGPDAVYDFFTYTKRQTQNLIERTKKSQECVEKEIEELQASLIESLRMAEDADDDEDDDNDNDDDDDDGDGDGDDVESSGSTEY